jgi:hypothetical protein
MKEEFEELKEIYIAHIKKYMSETGGLFPHLTVFAEHINKEENDKPAIIHIPIPDEFMETDDNKDKFIDEVMPEIILEVKKEFIPMGIAWASEAWMRVVDKDFDMSKENYRKLPKTEVLFMSIETKNNSDSIIYEIKREGKQVNSEGDLTDRIELKEMEDSVNPQDVGGRFSELYKKLID